MIALEVRYKNGEQKGVLIALCKKSSDEVETIMHNNNIAYTEIVSIRTPLINVEHLVKENAMTKEQESEETVIPNRSKLEMENTEYDYGHNVKHSNLYDNEDNFN